VALGVGSNLVFGRSSYWEKYIKNSIEIIEIECRNWLGEFFYLGFKRRPSICATSIRQEHGLVATASVVQATTTNSAAEVGACCNGSNKVFGGGWVVSKTGPVPASN
jgi:hypothetical protein